MMDVFFQDHKVLSVTFKCFFPLTAMTLSMLRKINWSALKGAASDLSMHELDEITGITEEMKGDDNLLRQIHHILFEVHLIDGHLVCPESLRKFPVKDGIPNMLLHEDEV